MCFSWLVLGAILFPAVTAGTPEEPELTDGSGDAPAGLDVLSAWWSTEREDRVAINIKLADLTVGQPLLDSNNEEIRWYYTLTFSTSAYATPITVKCIVGSVETSAPAQSPVMPRGQTPAGGDFGGTVGTDCRATPITEFHNREAFVVNTRVDKLNDVLIVSLTEQADPRPVDIGVGTTFSDLVIQTAGGKATSIGAGHRDTVYDNAGPGALFTMA